MKELGLILAGFILGVTALSILIIFIDNREWVRNLKNKNRVKRKL